MNHPNRIILERTTADTQIRELSNLVGTKVEESPVFYWHITAITTNRLDGPNFHQTITADPYVMAWAATSPEGEPAVAYSEWVGNEPIPPYTTANLLSKFDGWKESSTEVANATM